MPCVLFRNCTCGAKLKIFYLSTRASRFTRARCKREIELFGTVLEMHAGTRRALTRERDWARIPIWRLKNSA